MFTQKWRQYWGLKEEPFVCEDADKDVILQSIDASAVHSGFDRLFGNPRVPAPGIIFGEKGSGKSALRLMMRRRVDKFNEENEKEKIALIEYIDYNGYIESYRQAVGLPGDPAAASKEVVSRWKLADHLDCVLSLGFTQLADEVVQAGKSIRNLPRKKVIDLLLGTSLYYHSDQRTTSETLNRLRSLSGFGSLRAGFKLFFCILLSLLSIGVGLFPIWITLVVIQMGVDFSEGSWGEYLMTIGKPNYFYLTGLFGILFTWGWYFLSRSIIRSQAARSARAVKIVSKSPVLTAKILASLPSKERKDFLLPRGSDEAARYDWLHRFISLLEEFGYNGAYVLIDRLDEPSLLSGRTDVMREFIEKILDIKLLQYPQLGIKMFLPIELDSIHRNASPEQLKKMRLDKSNLIPELKWSGQELYEIANQRMKACCTEPENSHNLADLFSDEIDFQYIKETLNQLGTPRYAFGFLSTLITDFVRDLPNDLPDGDPRLKISKAHFDVARASWLDRTGVLRRVLN